MTEKRKPGTGRSVYEDLFKDREHELEDRAEWHLLATVDMTTGEIVEHLRYRPFNQTPLATWQPPPGG